MEGAQDTNPMDTGDKSGNTSRSGIVDGLYATSPPALYKDGVRLEASHRAQIDPSTDEGTGGEVQRGMSVERRRYDEDMSEAEADASTPGSAGVHA